MGEKEDKQLLDSIIERLGLVSAYVSFHGLKKPIRALFFKNNDTDSTIDLETDYNYGVVEHDFDPIFDYLETGEADSAGKVLKLLMTHFLIRESDDPFEISYEGGATFLDSDNDDDLWLAAKIKQWRKEKQENAK